MSFVFIVIPTFYGVSTYLERLVKGFTANSFPLDLLNFWNVQFFILNLFPIDVFKPWMFSDLLDSLSSDSLVGV